MKNVRVPPAYVSEAMTAAANNNAQTTYNDDVRGIKNRQ